MLFQKSPADFSLGRPIGRPTQCSFGNLLPVLSMWAPNRAPTPFSSHLAALPSSHFPAPFLGLFPLPRGLVFGCQQVVEDVRRSLFGLVARMTVGALQKRRIRMTQQLRRNLLAEIVLQKIRRKEMPLRYNNDKPKNRAISRV